MLPIDRGGATWAMSDAAAGTDYIAALERRVERLTGKSAALMCSADAAIHTALSACGVAAGDYVFVPTYTFYSEIATVTHSGAIPVFLDCEPRTRCVSPAALETALYWAKLQGKPPKAVIVADAFGSVADYDVLSPLCKAYGVPLIELAVDAFGGDYKGRACGGNGDYGVVSFCKRVGGGGAALILGSDEKAFAKEFCRARYTDGISHDYKMHNVIAALDCAMLAPAAKLSVRAKANLAALKTLDCVLAPVAGDAATYAVVRAKRIAGEIASAGFNVKTPPPIHRLPQYGTRPFFEHEQGFCVACSFSDCCLIDLNFSAAKRRRLMKLLSGVKEK